MVLWGWGWVAGELLDLGVLVLVVSASTEREFGLQKMLLEGRFTSCRIPVVKLKHYLDVMRNKGREVQCVTIYGMMVILLPEHIFNLYPA